MAEYTALEDGLSSAGTITLSSEQATTELDRSIAEYERRVLLEGHVEESHQLAELYRERLEDRLARLSTAGDTSTVLDEYRETLKKLNDLSDAAILNGRNDLFELLLEDIQRVQSQMGNH